MIHYIVHLLILFSTYVASKCTYLTIPETAVLFALFFFSILTSLLHLIIVNSVPDPSAFVQIIGEDAREFIAGLADNIVLEKDRAARMVTAAVAARTRSWLLQAWVCICIIVLEH